jgi:hypothetical protein
MDDETPTPYVYQEFPRWLYGAGGATRSVETDDEKRAALADGWGLSPLPVADVEPLATAPVGVVDVLGPLWIDDPLVPDAPASAPKRRGRPPKIRPQE